MLKKFFALLSVFIAVVTIGVVYEQKAESAADKVVGSGTAGRITKWLASSTVGDSGISEGSNGHVSIGQPPAESALLIVTTESSAPNTAVRGHNNGNGRGVDGTSDGGGIGVNGIGNIGVNGISVSTDPNDPLAAAIRGTSVVNGVPAGYFSGDVHVTGVLSKGAGSFRIDHPLDPENKYLSHSFVESPDMMNIYNGNITTDGNGFATVTLPNYFDALNRDFRYQLTVVGQFSQAIVAEKIRGNKFRIRTDKPAVEVSWQVTGIRKDKFAEENRIKVETEKEKRR